MTDTETDKGHQDWKLKAAGWSYILGDASMMLRGKLLHQPDVFRGGAIWMAGGIGAALFGNPDVKKQTEIVGSKLEDYLKSKGVNIPAEARQQNELIKQKSFWDHVTQFCYEHPSELLNGAYAIGAGLLLHGGYKDIKARHISLKDIGQVKDSFWMGALILPGALVGLFAKEDPKAQEKAQNGNAFDKAIAFVTEKPLRVSGTLYGLNNIFLARQTWRDWKSHTALGNSNKPFACSAVTLACYLFSNAMLFMSSRDQISDKGFDSEHIAKLEDAAARVIVSLPPEKQRELLGDVSEFMSKQNGIKRDAPSIARELAERITQLTGEKLQAVASNVQWVEREKDRATAQADVSTVPAIS